MSTPVSWLLIHIHMEQQSISVTVGNVEESGIGNAEEWLILFTRRLTFLFSSPIPRAALKLSH